MCKRHDPDQRVVAITLRISPSMMATRLGASAARQIARDRRISARTGITRAVAPSAFARRKRAFQSLRASKLNCVSTTPSSASSRNGLHNTSSAPLRRISGLSSSNALAVIAMMRA
jgi:hypothetical protein